jgi:hypothetical protein
MLSSVPGVGRVLSVAQLSDLPELSRLKRARSPRRQGWGALQVRPRDPAWATQYRWWPYTVAPGAVEGRDLRGAVEPCQRRLNPDPHFLERVQSKPSQRAG